MTRGTTKISSIVNFENNITMNETKLTIDKVGNIYTSGTLVVDNVSKFNSQLVLNDGLISDSGHIKIDNGGNITNNGHIFSKDFGHFRNKIEVSDSNSNLIFNFSISDNSYVLPDKFFGIGTSNPEYYLHVIDNIYSDNNIIANKKLIINPNGFGNLNNDSYTVNLGGDVLIMGKLYLYDTNGPQEISLRYFDKVTENINTLIKNFQNSDATINTDGSIRPIVNSSWITIGDVVYYNQGSVGIGTNAPIYPLHVVGNTSINGNQILLNGTVYYNNVKLDELISGLWTNNSENNNLVYIGINEDQKIGIGTTTPEYKLDVIGDIHTTSKMIIDNDLYIANSVGIGTTSPEYMLDVNGDLRVSGKFYINNKEYIDPETQNVYWTGNNQDNIYFNNNVGINVVFPNYALHISGEAFIDGNIYSNSEILTETLKINKEFIYNENLIIINETGMFIENYLYTNKFVGDVTFDSLIFNKNQKYALYKPNTKVTQLYNSINIEYTGIGITNNGMAFSNNGNLFIAAVPYGIIGNNSNGYVQVYNIDNVSKCWQMTSTISTSLFGDNSNDNYLSSVTCNKDGSMIGLSAISNADYKIILFNLDSENNEWQVKYYIRIDDTNAGKFLLLEEDTNWLFTNDQSNRIAFYTFDETNNDYKSSYAVADQSITSNNIGELNTMNSNDKCNIIIASSEKGPLAVASGTFFVYALWSQSGLPNAYTKNSFVRMGINMSENNTTSNVITHFGRCSTIASNANIDFSSNDPKTFKYNNMIVAIGTGGLNSFNHSPAFIKIYKFTYNDNNNSSGLIYSSSEAYIDGLWSEIGYIDHVTYNSIIGFGSDIKLNGDGSILYVGSPNENAVYIIGNDGNNTWSVMNKIQGLRSGDYGIGFKLAMNLNYNLFASSTCEFISLLEIDNKSYIANGNQRNNITLFDIEFFNDENQAIENSN